MENSIFSGNINHQTNEFILNKVKDFETQSVINENKLNRIFDYLQKAKNEESLPIIMINDQLPIRLNKEEIHQLLKEIENIRNELHLRS
jgi:glutaredoxin